MDNYEYCAAFIRERATSPDYRVLDYGCGKGQIVELLRPHLQAFGCDVFYGGGSYLSQVAPELLLEGVVQEMKDGRIPFADASFDAVVNNQVMEHVPDLDAVLAEVSRVLKPGGVVLSLFPDRSVWREGHSCLLFLHRFPAGSRARFYYAYLWRACGFGSNKENKTIAQWSADFSKWLDQWTYFRRYDEIERAYASNFSQMHHVEHEWLDRRLGLRIPLPAALKRLAVRRWGGMVFWCAKLDDGVL